MQISDSDLRKLEEILPRLYAVSNAKSDPRINREWGIVKEVISNVRWGFESVDESRVVQHQDEAPKPEDPEETFPDDFLNYLPPDSDG